MNPQAPQISSALIETTAAKRMSSAFDLVARVSAGSIGPVNLCNIACAGLMIMANNYDQKNIATMEMVYGKGYLSAGGDAEVADLFHELDARGASVLDLGCGLGGAAVSMIRDLGAGHVTAVDIDSNVLARAEELVKINGLQSRIATRLIEPGPLPFDPGRFDIVYMTAVACHFEYLLPLFTEIHRVLKPSGTLVGRDWIKIACNQEYTNWDNFLREQGLNFFFAEINMFSHAMKASGFLDIEFVDKTETMEALSQKALDQVNGSLKDALLEKLGGKGYEECVQWARIRVTALSGKGIGQYRFRARVPG